MGRRFWFSFIILGVLIVIVFYFRQKDIQAMQQSLTRSLQSVAIKNTIIPTPTPMPFADLTIPYLRSRSYKSSLFAINQIDQNNSYTSYVASYLSDGLKINGLLTVPTGTPPTNGWPAIVFVHGYIPPQQYTTLSRYVEYVDYLARNGFVVFKIDLRGNGDSQGEPAGAYYSAGYVIDTLNAYAALQVAHVASASAASVTQSGSGQSPSASSGQGLAAGSSAKVKVMTPTPSEVSMPTVDVNPKEIGLWGHSMAGNIVMRAWAARPTIPAVVIWAGAGYTYTDLMKYKIDDPSYQPSPASSNSANFRLRQQLQKLYGNPDLNTPFWHDMAPTSFLSDLKGAIQVDQAVDDTVVNIGYNRDLMQLFDKTSVPHQMYEYPSGGHNISGASFTQAMAHTVEFYKKYLE